MNLTPRKHISHRNTVISSHLSLKSMKFSHLFCWFAFIRPAFDLVIEFLRPAFGFYWVSNATGISSVTNQDSRTSVKQRLLVMS